jgi:hypothetical protein
LIENLKHEIDPAYIWYPVRLCISWESFKQKLVESIDYLFCYINWRAVNYHISSRHANSPEWLVLGWKYLPKSFYSCSWRVGKFKKKIDVE